MEAFFFQVKLEAGTFSFTPYGRFLSLLGEDE